MPVLGLTIDERDVFWTEEGEPFRAIRAAPKVGGVVRTLAEGRENPTQIISHGEFVYWLENTIRGGVVRARKDGTGLTRLPLPSPFSFAVNGGVVTSTSLETNTVERWSASSGPERIAWGQGAPQGIFSPTPPPTPAAPRGPVSPARTAPRPPPPPPLLPPPVPPPPAAPPRVPPA